MLPIQYPHDPVVKSIDMGLSGKEADMATKFYGYLLVKKEPFLAIQLPGIKYLKSLIEHAEMTGIYKSDGKYNICAYYKHDEDFPLARSYYIQFNSKDDCEIISQNILNNSKLKYIADSDIYKFAQIDSFEKRVNDFFEKGKTRSNVFSGLFDGREKIQPLPQQCISAVVVALFVVKKEINYSAQQLQAKAVFYLVLTFANCMQRNVS